MISYGAAVKQAVHQLTLSEIEDPLLDAQILFCEAYQIRKEYLLTHIHQSTQNKQQVLFESFIKQRCMHTPLAYILKKAWFNQHEYQIQAGVFIPRPETELIIITLKNLIAEKAIAQHSLNILECGYGTGILSIETALLKLKNTHIWGWDKNPLAYETASKNASLFKVSHIDFILKDFFDDNLNIQHILANGNKNILLSNPPYIARNDISKLEQQVKDFEPHLALDGEISGLVFYEKFLTLFKDFSITMIFEIGFNQKSLLEDCLKQYGYSHFSFIKDLQGIDRVLVIHS